MLTVASPFSFACHVKSRYPRGSRPVRSHGGRASSDRPRSTGELVDTLKSQMCHRSTCHPHRVDIHGEGTSLSKPFTTRITRDPGSELAPRGLFTASHTPLVGRSDKSSPYMINRQPRKPMECAPAAGRESLLVGGTCSLTRLVLTCSVQLIHKQQTTIRKPIKCAPEASRTELNY